MKLGSLNQEHCRNPHVLLSKPQSCLSRSNLGALGSLALDIKRAQAEAGGHKHTRSWSSSLDCMSLHLLVLLAEFAHLLEVLLLKTRKK